MLLHDVPFVVGERSDLAQDLIGHHHLADVVEQRSPLDRLQLLAVDAHRLGQGGGIEGDAERVAGRLVVAGIRGRHHGADRLDVGAFAGVQRFLQRGRQRPQGLLDQPHLGAAPGRREVAAELARARHLGQGQRQPAQWTGDPLHHPPGRARRQGAGREADEQQVPTDLARQHGIVRHRHQVIHQQQRDDQDGRRDRRREPERPGE
jgi:hypothetical protein